VLPQQHGNSHLPRGPYRAVAFDEETGDNPPVRRLYCVEYDRCLNHAIANDWPSWDCVGCSEKGRISHAELRSDLDGISDLFWAIEHPTGKDVVDVEGTEGAEGTEGTVVVEHEELSIGVFAVVRGGDMLVGYRSHYRRNHRRVPAATRANAADESSDDDADRSE
jgi:hypothetical protein